MILDRTLPTIWRLTGADVPALAPVTSRARTVVVADVETLCAAIVVDQSRRAVGEPLSIYDLHEALGFLLGQTAQLLPIYDPTRGRQTHDPWTAGFKAWLHLELTRDLIDHWRSTYGRQGQKRVKDPGVPHDEEGIRSHVIYDPADPVDPVEHGSDTRTDRLVAAVEGIAEDDPDAWFDGRLWNEHRRHRKDARKVEAVGLGAPAPAAGGDRTAGQREELAA